GSPPPTPAGSGSAPRSTRAPTLVALARLAAASFGPAGLDLGEDPLPELVAGPCEREGRVRVQALERAPGSPAGAADAEAQRGPAVAPRHARGELVPDPPLLLVG